MLDFKNKLSKLNFRRSDIRGLIILTTVYLAGAKLYFPKMFDLRIVFYYGIYILLGPICIYLIIRISHWVIGLTGFDKIDSNDVDKIFYRK